jgi:hypothetical protein
MSKHGRVKSKVVQATISDPAILELFQNVLGTGEGAGLKLEIVHPKYTQVVRHCGRFVRLLEALRDAPVMEHFPDAARHLAGYARALREQAAATFTAPDLALLHPPSAEDRMLERAAAYAAVTEEEYAAFAAAYGPIKECNVVNTIIVTCKNLVIHKKSLESPDPAKRKDRFLVRSAGLTFAPLPDLPAMNFKQLYISDRLTAGDRRFLMTVLHKLFTISHDVYDAMSTPDIDVGDFVAVIAASLDDVKRQIPRCDEAFDKIRDSVGLLEGNFDGYYKDFVASNNPSIIMENFVLDVSKSTSSSPKITGQFRRIIGHYRKLASQQTQHPKLQTLFQHVDKNFQELERRSRAADDSGGDDDDDDDDAGEEGGAERPDREAGPAVPSDPWRAVERQLAATLAAPDAPPAEGLAEELDRLLGEAGS